MVVRSAGEVVAGAFTAPFVLSYLKAERKAGGQQRSNPCLHSDSSGNIDRTSRRLASHLSRHTLSQHGDLLSSQQSEAFITNLPSSLTASTVSSSASVGTGLVSRQKACSLVVVFQSAMGSFLMIQRA